MVVTKLGKREKYAEIGRSLENVILDLNKRLECSVLNIKGNFFIKTNGEVFQPFGLILPTPLL